MLNSVDKTISIKFCLLLVILLFSSDVFLLLTSDMKNNISSLKSNDLKEQIGVLFIFIVSFSILVAIVAKVIAALLISIFSYKSKKTIKSKIKSKKYMRIYKIKNKAILNNNSTLYQYIQRNEENKSNFFIIMSLYVCMSIMLVINIKIKNSILHNLLIDLNYINSEYLFGGLEIMILLLSINIPILLASIYNDDNGYIFMKRSLFKKLYKYNSKKV
ncbi:hypothetical protein [Arcobacter sp.]|uniref:hypothetical protein n=1 Tax=Arcobacter sp. TaxID=1872629 RepID=UPI003D0F73DB